MTSLELISTLSKTGGVLSDFIKFISLLLSAVVDSSDAELSVVSVSVVFEIEVVVSSITVSVVSFSTSGLSVFSNSRKLLSSSLFVIVSLLSLVSSLKTIVAYGVKICGITKNPIKIL